MEVYDSDGSLLRVLQHGWCPYALAVDERGHLWLGEASFSHVVEICPTSGETLSMIDPKEDFTAENLFCYTYGLAFDRLGNLWTFNGQGDVGITLISPDKSHDIRFASKELGPEFEDSEPIPSPWHQELYLVSAHGVLSLCRPELTEWLPITSDIHAGATPRLDV